MSVSTAESELKRAQKALEDARRHQAAEEKKAAAAEKAGASKEQSAQRASSASSAARYRRSAQSKRDEAQKAQAKAAHFSAKAATAQTNVHRAQEKLAKARAAENKKRENRDAKGRSKREADERRQRQEADRESRRTAREQAAAERARRAADKERDQQVAALELELAEARATLDSRPWEDVPEKITVLFLTADPDGAQPLHIDREIRQIQEQVRSSKLRDSIAFEYRHAVRVTDLIQHLNEVQPDVVHFAGHGAHAGLALHDADDSVRLLTNTELADVLDAGPRPLKLAVFNSCNSAEQARVAVAYADAAVGMEQTIEDESARVFAGQLYNSLGFGLSLGLAFKQARQQVALTFGAVSGAPTLAVADRIDADELVVVSPHEPSRVPGRTANDVRVLRAIRGTLPRADIEYWRDQDLGGAWHGDRTHHLMELLYDHNAIEDRFIDQELEAQRVDLFRAVNALMGKCATYGFPHKTLNNCYELGDAEWRRDNPPEGERYERFEARREELNRLADELVRAYDALMSAAQPRLPTAFERSDD